MTPTDSKFENQLKSFYNSSSFVQMQPNRAIYKTTKVFMAVLTQEVLGNYGFPQNIFMLRNQTGETVIPPFIISSADYGTQLSGSAEPTVNSQKSSRALTDGPGYGQVMNGFQDTSPKARALQNGSNTTSSMLDTPIPEETEKNATMFQNNRPFMLIPYFPYFGNCTYYGSQLFLYPMLENNPACKLVPKSQVKPIENMRFGMLPVADKCENIIAQCS
jgi:hypothetical protein